MVTVTPLNFREPRILKMELVFIYGTISLHIVSGSSLKKVFSKREKKMHTC